MKIVVVGLGYVGLASAILLAEKNKVFAVDISKDRVTKINKKVSPIEDKEISNYLKRPSLNLQATTNLFEVIATADLTIIATPTDYDEINKKFNTLSVEQVIADVVTAKPDMPIVIKSTIPIGFTDEMRNRYKNTDIYFSPEFLREGSALEDNLYPSRIVIGGDTDIAKKFVCCMKEVALAEDVSVLLTGTMEAEAIKLFANAYLAMRVIFFNELDSYSLHQNLNTREIISGVSLDNRIGNYYNNPSFGYGGYCLPKDSKQLLSNFRDIPQNVIAAIVESNETRKKFLAKIIKTKSPKVVGIYRLTMKSKSDNFRDSSTVGIIKYLLEFNVKMIVYEPLLRSKSFMGIPVTSEISHLKKKSDLILCNRFSDELEDVKDKVFTRDIFGVD